MRTRVFFTTIFVVVHLLPTLACNSISRLADSGGTLFVVEVETDQPNPNEIVERAVVILRSKISAIGMDGEVERLPTPANQIEVKIYGTQDLEVVRKFLFSTYRLELKAVVSPPSPSPVQTFPNKEKAEEIADEHQQVLPYSDREGALSQFVIVQKTPIVTGEHIRSAQAVSRSGDDLDFQISLTLNPLGAVKLGEWTGENINNYLAVVLDDKIESVAYIRSAITESGEITGSFTKTTAEQVALSLNSGYLPATLRVAEERRFE